VLAPFSTTAKREARPALFERCTEGCKEGIAVLVLAARIGLAIVVSLRRLFLSERDSKGQAKGRGVPKIVGR